MYSTCNINSLNKEQDHLGTYHKMAEAAGFYLHQSFSHIDHVFEYELASIFFSELLNEINLTQKDIEIAGKLFIPNGTVDLLKSDMSDPMTTETLQKVHLAWDTAQLKASTRGYFFPTNTIVSNTSLLGHVNNLGFFIETLVNRHLIFLNMSDELNNFSYKTLERSQLLNRLIYIFKEEIDKNLIQLDKTSKLLKLRNSAVHFTPYNAEKFKVSLEELLGIWGEFAKILRQMYKREQFYETPFFELLDQYKTEFKGRWQQKRKSA